MSVYSGEVEIESGDFHMEFERFIVRDKEYSFSVKGDDDEGEFELEGVAQLSSAGEYQADTQVVYPTYMQKNKPWSGPVTIVIESAVESKGGKNCLVRGRWQQNQETWRFNGKLTPFKP